MPRDLEDEDSEQQQLVDICFQIGITAAQYMHKKSQAEIAEWVASQLRQCGFDTAPCGMSHGILLSECTPGFRQLVEEERAEKMKHRPIGGIQIVEAARPD